MPKTKIELDIGYYKCSVVTDLPCKACSKYTCDKEYWFNGKFSLRMDYSNEPKCDCWGKFIDITAMLALLEQKLIYFAGEERKSIMNGQVEKIPLPQHNKKNIDDAARNLKDILKPIFNSESVSIQNNVIKYTINFPILNAKYYGYPVEIIINDTTKKD